MDSPAQLLQQALRHHRAGEISQAQHLYRAVLEREPENFEALHWLGVLAMLDNRPDAALELIGKAVRLAPNVAVYHHNLAEACMSLGYVDRAVESYQRSLALDPTRSKGYAGLGFAYRRKGLEVAAADALRRATELGDVGVDVFTHLVRSLGALGRIDESTAAAYETVGRWPDEPEANRALGEVLGLSKEFVGSANAFHRVATLLPQDAHARYGLGVALAEFGQTDAALAHLREAIRLRADYPEAYRSLAGICLRIGRVDDAIGCYERGLHFRPDDVEIRRELAGALERKGRLAEAAEQYRAILKSRPEAGETAFHLAAVGGSSVTPASSPASYVTAHFDDFAEKFDGHLVEKLAYRAPGLIRDAVVASRPPGDQRLLDIIDLGCGTGLCAPLFKSMAASMVGVDLSPAMLAKARERGLYDELVQGELVEALRDRPVQFDLAIAGDVLVYFGDLEPPLAAVAAALHPGGRFAFTVEADGDSAGYRLCPTRRYVHGAPYVRATAERTGFSVTKLEPAVLRTENDRPVDGYIVLLTRPD